MTCSFLCPMKNTVLGSSRPRVQSGAKCFHKTFATVFTNQQWHFSLTLMGITTGCRKGLKYLYVLFEAKYAYTHSLFLTQRHAHAGTRARKQTALQTQLGFCRIQGGEADSCHGVWGRGLRGAKMSSHPSISITTVILPLQDLHTNFTAMLLKCLQSFHILQ